MLPHQTINQGGGDGQLYRDLGSIRKEYDQQQQGDNSMLHSEPHNAEVLISNLIPAYTRGQFHREICEIKCVAGKGSLQGCVQGN
jgi:hypothetical protein